MELDLRMERYRKWLFGLSDADYATHFGKWVVFSMAIWCRVSFVSKNVRRWWSYCREVLGHTLERWIANGRIIHRPHFSFRTRWLKSSAPTIVNACIDRRTENNSNGSSNQIQIARRWSSICGWSVIGSGCLVFRMRNMRHTSINGLCSSTAIWRRVSFMTKNVRRLRPYHREAWVILWNGGSRMGE